MNRLAATVALAVLAFVPGKALADRSMTLTFREVLGVINGGGTVPPECEGVWAVQDSVYDCQGGFISTSTSDDTLCAGGVLVDPGQDGFTCTGSATATTYTMTCSGSLEVLPDCTANLTFVVHGTRTGDSYDSVTTFESIVSGTGKGCEFFPNQCRQTNNHGTRTDSVPSGFCTTPTRHSTWGEMKIHYR